MSPETTDAQPAGGSRAWPTPVRPAHIAEAQYVRMGELSENDSCFFALAFYRQSMSEAARELLKPDLTAALRCAKLAAYWWDEYATRRGA